MGLCQLLDSQAFLSHGYWLNWEQPRAEHLWDIPVKNSRARETPFWASAAPCGPVLRQSQIHALKQPGEHLSSPMRRGLLLFAPLLPFPSLSFLLPPFPVPLSSPFSLPPPCIFLQSTLSFSFLFPSSSSPIPCCVQGSLLVLCSGIIPSDAWRSCRVHEIETRLAKCPTKA